MKNHKSKQSLLKIEINVAIIYCIGTHNGDYTACIKRERQTVSFRIRDSLLFLLFDLMAFIFCAC